MSERSLLFLALLVMVLATAAVLARAVGPVLLELARLFAS